ncbi:glycoside hydrolase family 13 protein [Phanerochaete carnosa HHB-10118-sp]|uniref:Alpha-amylase n=1 Tax=Phanerochaete carnosa (strain HHB-10118-sp) TaxID=650164 RepID=K5W345_PHACS|nr:glycoside hydrolase family 13 protein [Phanerochaete carnosa HHB-10118-sp]EKM53319.1 glycoside hydrolase family 13 protein [Phanerochaete carnosa HHB-10118-sp]
MARSSLACLLISLLTFVAGSTSSPAQFPVQAPEALKNVIVQMFEWTWDSVAAECYNFIGPAGYGFVQVSPAQEHVQGSQWWTDYQPVSYTLTSKRGDRDQYTNMINTCHAAGVGVIADTLLNHMSGSDDGGVGVGGSSFQHYVYPGIYEYQDFHHCGLEPDDNIVDYSNAVEVQTCQLDNLADLFTESEYVRSRLAAYVNDLLSLGVDGLRLDAAKHINANDIANITSRLRRAPYITQEVIFGTGEPITPIQYVNIGDVQEFRYTTAVQNAFSGSGISGLQSFDNLGWVPGTSANVFVSNHDTERNGNSLNANSPSNIYVTAMVFSLAHPYGMPTILSSYSDFTDYDAGAPNGGAGTCTTGGGTNGWLCQHRWNAIAGMVGFHNQVGTAAMNNWVSPQSEQIAFGRGSLGFVAINNADAVWTTTFATSLPDGTYCDVISGISSSGVCTGTAFTVSDGKFTAGVQARNAIAIHSGATGTAGATITVNFAENANTTWGENIFLVGSVPQLGSWSPNSALPLSPASYPTWTVSVSLPPNTAFEYKFIRKETNGTVVWESDPNRSATTPGSGSLDLTESWR